MIDMSELCTGNTTNLALHQLRQHCVSFKGAFYPEGVRIGLTVGAGLLLALFTIIRRVAANDGKPEADKDGAGDIVGNAFEGLIYGSLSFWAGASAGAILALLLHPYLLGVGLLVFALLAVLVAFGAAFRGNGGAVKVAGFIVMVIYAGGLVAAGATGLMVPGEGKAGPDYERYVYAMSLCFALTGHAGAVFATLFRGYHQGVGWLLAPLNASWGALGNLLGLMNHIASALFYDKLGDVKDPNRVCFVQYKKGFNLKDNFDFTEGDAMSGTGVTAHETVHVIQHFVGGPIYPLTHLAWVVTMFLPGLLAGWISSDRDVGQGITDFTYYNNPWEVMAYTVKGTRHDTGAKQPLIFNEVAAWIITVLWIGGGIAGLVAILVTR